MRFVFANSTIHNFFMIPTPFQTFILFLFLSSCIGTGCVGKAKYYDTLQQKASLQSELGMTEVDLKDARSEIDRQEALVRGLRMEIERLDGSVNDLSSQSKSAQIQIGASLNKVQQELDNAKVKLADSEKQLSAFKRYHSKREGRLVEVGNRLETITSNLPRNQVSTMRYNDEAVMLQFGEGLFFIKNSNKISDFGNALVQKLASSLSGQSDLLIEVVAYPAVPVGYIQGWESASQRANTLANCFVNEYGLSPKQVSSVAQQGEIVVIDGAPAESKQRKTVELMIRLNPVYYAMPRIGN